MNGKGTPNAVYIVETLMGVFGVTEEGKIVERVLYPPDPKQIAVALDRQSDGEVTREVSEIVEKLKQRGFGKFVFSNNALVETLREDHELATETRKTLEPTESLRDKLEGLAVELGVVDDASKFYTLIHEVSMLRARRAVQRAQSERESTISQTVQLLNELDKTLNSLSGKLREWYGLHFPELGRHVQSHETYARIVNTFGDRANLDAGALGEMGFKGGKTSAIIRAAQDSMGAPLMSEDLEQLRRFSSHLLSLYGYRPEIEDHVASTAREVAPNLSEVAGPVLGAKLIEKAGGIRRLAMMPSSTIQILGAEKALFRAKKTRSKPPKHGLIFQHPFVHSRPRKLRGRAARALAAKLSVAARADAFSGNPIGAELRKELEEKEIQ